jgi:hypothetical protein
MDSIDGAINSLIGAQQFAVRSEINMAVMAKQMDAQELRGQAAVEMIEVAAQLSKDIGKGTQFDSLA